MIKFVANLLQDESGAELVEYGIGASVLAAVAVAGYVMFDDAFVAFFTEVGAEIQEGTNALAADNAA